MGIIADLSKYQGTIDFAKLASQVDGVILRVQHGYTHPDEKYKEYVAGCKQYGIPFGTYAYFAGISVNDAIAEADSAFDKTDPDSKFFVLDIEEVSMADLVRGGQAFIDRLKSRGIKTVGLYSGEYFYSSHNLGAIRSDFQWIAKYGVNDGQQHTPPSLPEDDLWQFTSVGHLDGIVGNVDLNIVTNPNEFNFFNKQQTVVTPVADLSPQFCTKQTILQTLRCDGPTDIRVAPNHAAAYVRDTVKGETFHVFDKVIDSAGHCWNNLGGANWVDEASGVFYWLDNPNLKQAAPQPIYYTIRPGDELSRIAANNGTTVAQLQSWNNISNPNIIYAGKQIRVK
jgi:GH25 family lysozyme M1 (1,4-beta-N-acetylmuramidase)